MQSIIPFVQSFLTIHPHIVYLVIFLGIFFAATFPFAFFWYGEFIFIPASILVGLGILSIWWVLVSSIVGAFLGDMINYHLGYRYGRGFFCPNNRFLNPEMLKKGEIFFEKYGIWGVFLAKFIPFIPWTISFLAGLHRMNLVFFIIVDIFSGVVIFGGIYGILGGGVHFIGQLLNLIW
ncbi:MAG: VTT domain-containing protein [Candidatus Gracilibacteria bacterium]